MTTTRQPRWTTRGLMLGVLGLGVVMGLVVPAVQIGRDPGKHLHVSFGLEERRLIHRTNDFAEPPFWPRYRLYLLGREWRKQPICGEGEGEIGETCEFDRPDLVRWVGDYRILDLPPVRINGGRPLKVGDLVPEHWTPPPTHRLR